MMYVLVIMAGLGCLALPRRWAFAIVLGFSLAAPKLGDRDVSTLLLAIYLLRVAPAVLKGIGRQRFLLAYAVFTAWAAVSLLWAVNVSGGAEPVRAYLRVLFAMGAALISFQRGEDFIPTAWAIVGGVVYSSVRTMMVQLGYATDEELLAEMLYGRVFVSGRNPNTIALDIAWGTTIALYMFRHLYPRKRSIRWFAGAVLLACSVPAVAMLGSRAAMVCLFIGPVILLAMSTRRKTPVVLAAVLLLTGSSFVLWLTGFDVDRVSIPFASPATTVRVQSMLRGEDDTGRLNIWRVGLVMAAHHPLTGVGAGNAREYYAKYAKQVWVDLSGVNRRTLHNTYINILAELGLVGVLLFAWALMAFFQPLQVQSREALALASLIVFLALFTGITHNFEQATFPMLMCAIAYRWFQLLRPVARKAPPVATNGALTAAEPPHRIPEVGMAVKT